MFADYSINVDQIWYNNKEIAMSGSDQCSSNEIAVSEFSNSKQ